MIPARVYKPRDKSLVEGAVKLIYRSIYTRLDGRTFGSLESLNAALRSALEIHNNKPFSGSTYSWRDQFEDIEREVLGPLNPLRYEIKKQTIVTVMKNGYVRLGEDVHYYSVPYKYIGKKVKVLYNLHASRSLLPLWADRLSRALPQEVPLHHRQRPSGFPV